MAEPMLMGQKESRTRYCFRMWQRGTDLEVIRIDTRQPAIGRKTDTIVILMVPYMLRVPEKLRKLAIPHTTGTQILSQYTTKCY